MVGSAPVPRTSQRRAGGRPIVLVFQLPESPAPNAACYYARTDQAEALAKKHVQALPDRDLPGEGNAAMFAAVEKFGEDSEVRHELFADGDYHGTHSFWCGFLLDVTPAQLSKALTEDGFFALELKAPIFELLRQLSPSEITRRLELCSFDQSLEATRQSCSLPHHARDEAGTAPAATATEAPPFGAPATGTLQPPAPCYRSDSSGVSV